MEQKKARIGGTVAIAVAACAWVSSMIGCYERVIAVRGPGADQVQVYEPYQEGGSEWENWIMGPPNDPAKRNGSRLNR